MGSHICAIGNWGNGLPTFKKKIKSAPTFMTSQTNKKSEIKSRKGMYENNEVIFVLSTP